MATSRSFSSKWQFEVGDGWKDCDADMCARLDSMKIGSTRRVQYGTDRYSIQKFENDRALQTNLASNHARILQRVDETFTEWGKKKIYEYSPFGGESERGRGKGHGGHRGSRGAPNSYSHSHSQRYDDRTNDHGNDRWNDGNTRENNNRKRPSKGVSRTYERPDTRNHSTGRSGGSPRPKVVQWEYEERNHNWRPCDDTFSRFLESRKKTYDKRTKKGKQKRTEKVFYQSDRSVIFYPDGKVEQINSSTKKKRELRRRDPSSRYDDDRDSRPERRHSRSRSRSPSASRSRDRDRRRDQSPPRSTQTRAVRTYVKEDRPRSDSYGKPCPVCTYGNTRYARECEICNLPFYDISYDDRSPRDTDRTTFSSRPEEQKSTYHDSSSRKSRPAEPRRSLPPLHDQPAIREYREPHYEPLPPARPLTIEPRAVSNPTLSTRPDPVVGTKTLYLLTNKAGCQAIAESRRKIETKTSGPLGRAVYFYDSASKCKRSSMLNNIANQPDPDSDTRTFLVTANVDLGRVKHVRHEEQHTTMALEQSRHDSVRLDGVYAIYAVFDVDRIEVQKMEEVTA